MKWLPLILLVPVLGVIVAHVAMPSARAWAWKVAAGFVVLALPVQGWMGLAWAPAERDMGDVYRIVYMHVPHVWNALIALTLNFCCSVAFLMKKSWVSDSLAEASAEVGLYFGVVGVTLGAIWAKPTWGAYWDWDPRLTTSAIMIVVYAGYLALRRFIEDPDKRATWSAVLGIFAAVDLPVIWFSVKWWKSLHQKQSEMGTTDGNMRTALFTSGVILLALLFVFLVLRFRIAMKEREAEVAPPQVPSPHSPPLGLSS
jgi:heme exporter protein C